MSFPKYKIEVYNTTGTLKHTLESDVLNIHTKETVNDTGSFNFAVSNNPSSSYPYSDILENWAVKIYFGYGAASTLVTVGKIKKITTPLDSGGNTRVFEGKNQTAVLESRQKTNKNFQATHADDIAAEVATDLSLGNSFDADTNPVSIHVATDTYMELMKSISDYWVSAGVQLKKDFYVNTSNALVWKNRPIRASGVSPLTLGVNILSYSIIRDILAVKNNITVKGAATAPIPNDKDLYTDGLDYWTASSGTLNLGNIIQKAGTYYIQCVKNTGNYVCDCTLTLPRTITTQSINTLYFWYSANGTTPKVRLLAPDNSNYFEATLTRDIAWHWFDKALGPSGEYDVDENPSGAWTKTGTPNWWDITAIRFYNAADGGVNRVIYIDKLYFYPERWAATVSDATSITGYDQQDAEFTDDNLTSNTECEIRGRTLLYQLKDPVIRLDLLCEGDTNILIGDRIPLTIPAEGLSAANFDVINSEHNYATSSENAFTTTIRAVNSGNIRLLPPGSLNESVVNQIKTLKQVTSNIYSNIVK